MGRKTQRSIQMSLASTLPCRVCVDVHENLLLLFSNNFVNKMYTFWTVSQLKAELRNRNASTAGKKAVLIERLEAYDRNFNFNANPEPGTSLSDPQYRCPPTSSFKDINADSPIPALNRQEIQSYFERFNAQPKGKAMYEARCLLTARYFVEGANTYIQGQCKAQMKKVVYIVNIQLSNEGNIEQCHCECAAGSGIEAHCKHISVLLCAIENMVHSKTIILHQVCTQTIMTSRSIVHGKTNEPIAIQKYETEFQLNIHKCGLFICLQYPFLAASPDGLIGEKTVVEVKCPYTARFKPINAVTVPYLENSIGQLTLKRNHPYYAQIQGQLLCTGRKFCNLIIYSFKEIQVCFINRDNIYIEEMVRELSNFYECNLKPEIINKYFYKNYDSLIKPK